MKIKALYIQLPALATLLATLSLPVFAGDEVHYAESEPNLIKEKLNKARITGKAPPHVALLPDGNNQHWILLEALNYQIGDTDDILTVPAGFVTDFASIPKALWSLGLSPHGRYSRAAIIHDFLYWSQVCTKTQSDRLLVLAMKESNVAKVKEKTIFAGVKVGGASSWAENKKLSYNGYIRVVPLTEQRPPPNMGWEEFRYNLILKGIVEDDYPRNPAFCKHGNSFIVPGGNSSIKFPQGKLVEKIGTPATTN